MSLRTKLTTFTLICTAIATAFGSAAYAIDCSTPPPAITGADLPTFLAGGTSALQDNPTGFGDVSTASTDPTEGSEADQLFLSYDATNLNIGLTGNTPLTDNLNNSFLIFLDVSNANTSNVLETTDRPGGSGALVGMDGVILESALTPEYVIEVWNVNGIRNAVRHDLTAAPMTPATVLTQFSDWIWNNANLLGVNEEPSQDPVLQTQNAATATSGFQVRLSKASLGIANGSTVRVWVLIAGGGGFMSNQALPPLGPNGGVPCVGNSDPMAPVDFSSFSGLQYLEYTLTGPQKTPTFLGTNIPAGFSPIAAVSTQNNYTCFDDAAAYQQPLAEGSEIDQLYIDSNSNGILYVGVTGCTPINDGGQNTLLIFLQVPSFTEGFSSNKLFTASLTETSNALRFIDGLQLDGDPMDIFGTGFRPNYCIQFWRENGANRAFLEDLVFDVTTPLVFSNDATVHNLVGDAYVVNLTNTAGVNNIAGDDPLNQEGFAKTAISGMQFSINLSSTLGIAPTDQIHAMACIVNGGGFISNQFLPPLRPTGATLNSDDLFNSAGLPRPITANAITTDSRTTVNAAALERVTGIKCTVNITHPNMSQLEVSVRHDPTGRAVKLWDNNTNGANMNTRFVEGGAALTTWVAPGAGDFDPAESLLTFNDVDPNAGTWSLVVNNTGGSAGTINSWRLELTEAVGGGVDCIGLQTISTPVDLNTFNGNQYLTKTLTGTESVSAFTAANIPTAFGDPTAMNADETQNNYTCFGDAQLATPPDVPGSELDQMLVTNELDRLRVGLTGNLEENGNAFILLLDTIPGATGINEILGFTTPPPALGGFTGGVPGNGGGLNGLDLEGNFLPDYAVTVQREAASGVPNDGFDVYLTNLLTKATNKVGRTFRNNGSGVLAPPVPNEGGSELNRLYVQHDADHVYIGLTGNLEANENSIVILIDTAAAGGSNPLDTNYLGIFNALKNMAADTLDMPAAPNYAIVMHRQGGSYQAQLINLTVPAMTSPTFVPITFDDAISPAQSSFYGDNGNGVGVNDISSNDDPMNPGASQQAVNAATAVRGFQFSILRSQLGNVADETTLNITAAVVAASGFWSNQVLPGLQGTQANLGALADLTNATVAPGDQYASHVLAVANQNAPTGFDGLNIPSYMSAGSALKATQNNYTGFGNAVLPAGSGNPQCMQVAFNNGNYSGVTGTSAANPQLASSGMEFDIPFSYIGLTPLMGSGPFTTIKLQALLTGNSGFLSNQSLPGLGRGNVANIGFVDANTSTIYDFDNDNSTNGYPGDQFLNHTLVIPGDAADINGDGVVNPGDVIDFVGVLLGTNVTEPDFTNSDVNNDSRRDGQDIQPFVNEYIN